MSYIKSCNQCGERISMRQMSSGQWVAFDANTDNPHQHRKVSKRNKPINSATAQRNVKKIERPRSSPSDKSGYVIAVVVIVVLYLIFSG